VNGVMECGEVRDLLEEYLDGDLGAKTVAAVEAHVASCAECRAELERAQAEQAFLKQHLHAKPPPAEVRHRLDAALARPVGVPGGGVPWTRWLLRVAAGVLLAAGITFLTLSLRSPRVPRSDKTPAPAARTEAEVAESKLVEVPTEPVASAPIRWDDQNGRFPLLTPETARAQRYLAQAEREAVAAITLTAARARAKAGDTEGAETRIQFLLTALGDTDVAQAYERGLQ
jgi:hypothetical protein